jgi:hypothetical protein
MDKRKYEPIETFSEKRRRLDEYHPSLSKCEENIESGFYILNIKTKHNTNFFVLEKLTTPFNYNLDLFKKTWMSSKYNIESVCEYKLEACNYNSHQFEDPVATWIFYLPYGFVNNEDEIGYCPEKDFNTLNYVELKLKYPKSFFSFN